MLIVNGPGVLVHLEMRVCRISPDHLVVQRDEKGSQTEVGNVERLIHLPYTRL